MPKYNFNVPSKLPNGVNHKTLELEIKQQLNSSFSILHYGDDLDIIFDSTLSSGDQTTLNDIIDNHDESSIVRREKFFSVNPWIYRTKNNKYTSLASFSYGGSFHVGPINYIDIVARRTNSSITYDLRVVDTLNSNVLCEQTELDNNEFAVIDMGTISNMPNDPTILDVQVKRSGSNKFVYLSQIVIYYDNS